MQSATVKTGITLRAGLSEAHRAQHVILIPVTRLRFWTVAADVLSPRSVTDYGPPTLQMHPRGVIAQKHVDIVTEAPHISLSRPTDILSSHFGTSLVGLHHSSCAWSISYLPNLVLAMIRSVKFLN